MPGVEPAGTTQISGGESVTWNLHADVVIVGYGAAGVAAALEAAEAGADVVAVDRYAGGGASAISGGVVYAGGGTAVQREAGVEDSVDDMYAYLAEEIGDAVTPETLRRFCDGSAATIDWLSARGVPFSPTLCPYKTSYPSNRHYLYYSGSEAAGRFRAVATPAPRGHRARGKGTSGKMLFGPLARTAKDAGVQLLPQTRVCDLLVEDGRVRGVECRTLIDAPERIRRVHRVLGALSAKPGIYVPQFRYLLERRLAHIEKKYSETVRIEARRGVVLSAGGFVADRVMMKEHAPDYTGGLALGTAGDDGSGIALGAEIGAATAKLGNVSAWRFIVPPDPFLGSLLIDGAGRRMVDESRYGAALGHAIVTTGRGRGWVLVDADLAKDAAKRLPRQAMWFQRVQNAGLRSTAVRGRTVEQVARAAGIDPRGLRETVDRHNAAIASGSPDPFGKHDDFRRPIASPPFTVYDAGIPAGRALSRMMNPCPMITLGGLVVDEDTGEVKDDAGEAIRGLYAAGRTAVGLCSNSYVSGLSLADCIFSGRRAGINVAMGERHAVDADAH
ncbi:FAD-binding protein [Rhodococcus sp. BP-252]|uniref:23S rRNA methyltransferase n=1 Tax=Rhodococcoides kyotonense TaxID=398843 RepID=A0A177YK08_9NOCA|nr:FAD-binding protein [Rhodococcus sp. BP-320]MBY6418674.1 FAD-binding protein [Rhodococcus sp. BP-321]MBY6422968.1 FAD-binding protein [Rhodococcus sp. BP-324]MBY6427938.1 FAD-binding protein [Rhodococcus sp. BP-323]MBY6433116.1 FAD-binding protein [Rhodococcus sp. BP-322]MBY6442044.1 FAD-binding protein [Rhodococcus sp. BP-319]MBY6446912.1 FAD-binding protein [Rhodococcus sp. BP-318]MBY6451710.1 FAD-binding protein [Rhodococcus sp. BP-315]MBY6456894.1 FAD-binding protein [Rhodococcus sp.